MFLKKFFEFPNCSRNPVQIISNETLDNSLHYSYV